jgi:excisionase family DNA binding protein
MAKEREPWLTTAQAAEYMGLSADALLECADEIEGAGRTRRGRGHWRFKASDLDRYMRQRLDSDSE